MRSGLTYARASIDRPRRLPCQMRPPDRRPVPTEPSIPSTCQKKKIISRRTPPNPTACQVNELYGLPRFTDEDRQAYFDRKRSTIDFYLTALSETRRSTYCCSMIAYYSVQGPRCLNSTSQE